MGDDFPDLNELFREFYSDIRFESSYAEGARAAVELPVISDFSLNEMLSSWATTGQYSYKIRYYDEPKKEKALDLFEFWSTL